MIRSHSWIALTLLAACSTGGSEGRSKIGAVPAPMANSLGATAYEAAFTKTLPEREPIETPALHRVYPLSEQIISGAEPTSELALKEIAGMGVRTILSVDGKAPDGEAAAKYGLRYVHVPIRYNGITEEEQLAIAKTFRELDGPFYVHCYHGQHRGPAAAAIGRVLLDGASREQAVAEMAQWCGTSEKYEGLYGTIAFGDLPTVRETEAFAFDFPTAHRFEGTRAAMVEAARAWDIVEHQSRNDWQPDPSHPDANARNEAQKLAEVFSQMASFTGADQEPEDFRTWLREAQDQATSLRDTLDRLHGGDASAAAEAVTQVKALKASCSACHRAYRN